MNKQRERGRERPSKHERERERASEHVSRRDERQRDERQRDENEQVTQISNLMMQLITYLGERADNRRAGEIIAQM